MCSRKKELKDKMKNILSQAAGKIDPTWVLLDSESTIDLFCNALLLTNIRKVDVKLNIFCNAGKRTNNMVGELEGYGIVWYYADGIANILLLYRISQRSHVTYDSHEENFFYSMEDLWDPATVRSRRLRAILL